MASDLQKTDLLFKQFTGVVNTNQSGTFAQEEYAFQDFIFNDGVLLNNIPVDLSDISLNGVYGIAALDASFAQNGATFGDRYAIPNTDLVFYYKRLLQKAYANSNRSWYVADANDSTISELKGTIPFKYDAKYDSYRQNLWNNAGTSVQGIYNRPLYWLIDYKSGFVKFYGEEDEVNNWVSLYGPPRFSYIRYEGPRGSGERIEPGSDISFNMLDARDISCDNLFATSIESNTFTRNSNPILSIGEISSVTSGNYINIKEPTLIYRTTNSNGSNYLNNLGGGTFPTAANGIQFFDSGSTNQFPVQRRGFSSLPTPLYTNWAQTSPYRFDCVIATSLRNGTTASNKQLTSAVSYLQHASSDGWSAYEVSSTGQGSSVFLTRHLMSYDCLIRAITVQPMGIYCSINNTTGSSVVVSFELWVTYEDGINTGTPGSFTQSFFYASAWPSDMLTTDIKNNNLNSDYARRIYQRIVTISNGSSSIYNPFLTGNTTFNPVILNLDPPLYVPKGKAVIVHAVERRVTNISSGNIEFTTYAYGLGGTGHAAGAMVCNVVGELNFNT
jgi:hypothetical protein